MAFIYQVILQDSEGKPLVDTTVRAYAYGESSSAPYRGKNRTDDSGLVQIEDSKGELPDNKPNVKLKYYDSSHGKSLDLTDKHDSRDGDLWDFGTYRITADGPQKQAKLTQKSFAGTNPANLNTESLQRRVTELEGIEASLNEQLAAKTTEATEEKAKRQELEATQQNLNDQLQAQIDEVDREKAKRVKLEKDLEDKKDEVDQEKDQRKELERELNRLRWEASSSQKKAEEDEKKITELNQQISELAVQQGADTSLTDFFEGTQEQVEKAAKNIQKKRGKFRLGKVQMKIKALPVQGGKSLKFFKKEEMSEVSSDSLSEIQLELSPNQSGQVTQKKTMPDVSNYTEALALRKLEALGLDIEILYEAITERHGQPKKAGRVVRQFPSPGKKIEPGASAMIAIGKPTEP